MTMTMVKKMGAKKQEWEERGKKDVIIELQDVKKTYLMGEVKVNALNGVNLKIRKGEFVAIIGPSGSGKSTMLQMIGCLDVPSAGVVKLDNINITELSESDLAQLRCKKIGFVFQNFNLIPALTALDNVILPMMFHDFQKREREYIAKELLTKFGLQKRLYHKPTELSGGEQQRVAIARALATNPDVILADEPTGNLDLKSGKEIMNLLSHLNKEEKKTLIIVTHERFIAEYADRVVRLMDGKIVWSGPKEEVRWNEIKKK